LVDIHWAPPDHSVQPDMRNRASGFRVVLSVFVHAVPPAWLALTCGHSLVVAG
jgi:hypothetical protein